MGLTPDGDTLKTITISDAEGIQQLPDVCFGNENYLVVWYETQGDSGYSVVAARVTPAWEVLDSGTIIDPGSVYQVTPALAFDGARFLVVWRDLDQPPGIRCRFVATDAQPQGPVINLSQSMYAVEPRIVFGEENYLLVWQEYTANLDILGQLVSPDGTLVGGTITIASGPDNQYSPSVCYDGTNYLVVWIQDQVWGQFVSNSGDMIGSSFPISASPDTQWAPNVAYGNGSYLAVWTEVAADLDIYGSGDIEALVEEPPVVVTPQMTKIYPARTIISNDLEIIGGRGRNVTIFDLTGRKVGQTSSGIWDAVAVPAGVYFIGVEDTKFRFKIVKIM